MARDSRWFFAHLGGVGEVGVPPAEEVVLEFMEALASNEGEEEVVVSRLAAEVALMPWNAHLVGVLVAHGFDAATGSFPSGLSAETKKRLYQSVRHEGVGACTFSRGESVGLRRRKGGPGLVRRGSRGKVDGRLCE